MDEAQAKMLVNKAAAEDEAFLIRVKAKLAKDEALSIEEERRMTELLKAETVGKFQLLAAKARPKPTVSKK